MRKCLIIVGLFVCLFSFAKQQQPARRLVSLLTEMLQREEVDPDSFFTDVQLLRHEIECQNDSASRAIYRATLAHLLVCNSNRAQTWSRDTASPLDSIQEWTSEEYLMHAGRLYDEALSNMALLHTVKTQDWIPLVNRGRDEKIYDGDMLYVILKAYQSDISRDNVLRWHLHSVASAITMYCNSGCEAGALRLTLDTLESTYYGAIPVDTLFALRGRYNKVSDCAMVYQRLADHYSDSLQLQKYYLEEALRLYPKCVQRNEIRNRLLEMQSPLLNASIQGIYYPGKDMQIPLRIKNMKSARWTLYRIPNDFDENEDNLTERVKKQGECIQTLSRKFTIHPSDETWNDTLDITTPDCGNYALIMEGATSAKVDGKPSPSVQIFQVSRLAMFYRQIPPRTLTRVTIVDSQTGEPQSGVKVESYSTDRSGEHDSLLQTAVTDARGEVQFRRPDNTYRYKVRFYRTGDEALKPVNLFRPTLYTRHEQKTQNLHIFTDRGIYRPGQTVYVSALAYSQKGWDAQVLEGQQMELTLLDANRQKVITDSLKTDEFGVLQDSLQLPTGCLPGHYTIQVGSESCSISVEEYRLPTFYAEIDDKNAIIQDGKILVTGQALTYSGVPVSNARVTGIYTWQQHWRFWRFSHADRYYTKQSADTIQTDMNGKFQLEIPVPTDAEEQIKWGLKLTLMLDVLSPQGETQSVRSALSYSTTPLRMDGSIPSLLYREKLTPWKLSLASQMGKPVVGTIACRLMQKNQQVATFQMTADSLEIPSALNDLPSGTYQLLAKAEVQGDTASYQQDIVLVSMEDTRPVDDAKIWVHSVDGTFGPGKPARVKVGSSLDDAWIYCHTPAADGLPIDTLIHLNDSLVTLTVPYLESYQKGTNVVATLYHDGQFYTKSFSLELQQPDITLRPHWETFRDHLHPGQQEEWRLSLKCPDGTPAQANVMLSLYDASLGALCGHGISFSLSRMQYCLHTDTRIPSDWNRNSSLNISLSPRYLKTRDMEFSQWNSSYFTGMEGGMMMLNSTRGVGHSRLLLKEVAPTRVFAAARANVDEAVASAPMALEGSIAGLDMNAKETTESVEEQKKSEETADASTDDVSLRTHLQELAFFQPTLRTDDQGQVSIAFTLPENLTSWRLTGFAHTRDLMSVNLTDTIVAQKDLMAQLYLPRFLRTGDEGTFTATVRNLTREIQQGTAQLQLLDSETGKVLSTQKCAFHLDALRDTTYTFSCPTAITNRNSMLTVRWSARSEQTSDGEQRYLPILSSLQTVTETKAFSLDGAQRWKMDLSSLFAMDKSSAQNRTFTIEFTARPLWLALQSLPSLVQPRHSDVLSLVSAYYAGTLAGYIARQVPGMEQVVNQWSQEKQTLDSPLSKNQELADILLQETPWMNEANREQQRRQQLVTLFQQQSQISQRQTMLNAVHQLQNGDGSCSWYPGMEGSPYLTREVALLLTRLHVMQADSLCDTADEAAQSLLYDAISYLQNDVAKSVQRMREQKEPQVMLSHLRYLYILKRSGYQPNKQARSDVDYLLGLLRKQADTYQVEERSLAAIVLYLYKEEKVATQLMEEVNRKLTHKDGYYLAYPSGSFTCIDRKVQTHVQVMEAVRMVEPQSKEILQGMQKWLLQQKRTQEWEQPVQTADAVYALLSDAESPSLGQGEKEQDVLRLQNGSQTHLLTSPETPLGYLRQRMEVSHPKNLMVDKRTNGISWGAVYAQYQMPMDEIESQRSGLNVRRDVDASQLRVGDRIHVRYTITADRDYEYLCLTAPRPASAEPTEQISGYGYQGGVGYYRAVHDSSTEYFFNRMPRGTYVIEEDWLVGYAGEYTCGSARINCMYAPEYQAHTAGNKIQVR